MAKDYFFDGGNVPRIDSKAERERDRVLLVDDTTFTFRVNADLKDQFLALCKSEQYSASSVLKRYMLRCVKIGDITHDFRRL